MDWLQSLLWDPSSVAHIVFLYAFVVAAGVYLGKIKIFGVSLGVTFVLFAGILMGHFGFTADTHILHFIREFGLILFVFCIGLQVGPSFFSSFKKGGMTLNLLAVGIVVLNIAVALGLYYLWNGRVELPMMVGILYGAVTNTPGLGAANEALNQLSYNGPQIALGYACAYPLGVVGIIGSIIAIRYIFRVNMAKEEESLKMQSGDAHHKPHMLSLEVRNESISGKTLIEIKEFLGRQFVCSRIRHEGHVSIPNHETIFNVGDQLFIVCSEEDAPAITVFIGKEVDIDWEKQDLPMEVDAYGYVLQFKERRSILLGSEGEFVIFFLLPTDFSFPIDSLLYSADCYSVRRYKFFRERESNLFPGKNTDCNDRLLHKVLHFVFSE